MGIMSKKESPHSKILLVEDEETLAIGLEYNLSEEGYRVDVAQDGKVALNFIENRQYDLIILDIMLPFVDGFEIARIIREKDPKLPVLILTARTSIKDKVKALETGADDYLTKPFHLDELLLRVKGMLKRKSWYNSSTSKMPYFRFGPNKINFENLTVSSGQEKIQLTSREAMLIKYLIDHQGKVISRQELLQEVWNINSEIETLTVDNFIARLRKYFEEDPASPKFIKSLRGSGYLFSVDE